MMAMKRSVLAGSLQNLLCFDTTSSGEEDLKLAMKNGWIKERRGVGSTRVTLDLPSKGEYTRAQIGITHVLR